MKLLLVNLFLLLASIVAYSQHHVPNEILVQLKPGYRPELVVEYAQQSLGITAQMAMKECVYEHSGIWLLTYNEEQFSSRDVIYTLEQIGRAHV